MKCLLLLPLLFTAVLGGWLNPFEILGLNSETGKIFQWVELLRSKFKRSTQKLRNMSTQNDYVFKVDIEDRALQYLGRHKAFYLAAQPCLF